MKTRCPDCKTIFEVDMDVQPGQHFRCLCGHKFAYDINSAVVEVIAARKVRCLDCRKVFDVDMDVFPGQHFQCLCGHKFAFGPESAVAEATSSTVGSFTTCSGCGAALDLSSLPPEQEFICPLCSVRNHPGNNQIISSASPEISGPAAHAIPLKSTSCQADQLNSGMVVGHCQIKRKLGEGAMGVVYLGQHTTLDVPVALKVMLPQFARQESFKQQFYREAQTAARLNHPNVVRVLDCGEHDGFLYLIMEYVDGGNLDDELRRDGRLPPERVLAVGKCIASALVAASRLQIVHRDIKPANIICTRDGHVKLADLGLAKQLSSQGHTGKLTVANVTMGTPYYMSPEQALDAGSCDARADIYSLGATMYHLLTGRPPFMGPDNLTIFRLHASGRCDPPSRFNKDISPCFEMVIARMLMKRPEDRFADADAVLQALEGIDLKASNSVPAGKWPFPPVLALRRYTALATAALVVVLLLVGSLSLLKYAGSRAEHSQIAAAMLGARMSYGHLRHAEEDTLNWFLELEGLDDFQQSRLMLAEQQLPLMCDPHSGSAYVQTALDNAGDSVNALFLELGSERKRRLLLPVALWLEALPAELVLEKLELLPGSLQLQIAPPEPGVRAMIQVGRFIEPGVWSASVNLHVEPGRTQYRLPLERFGSAHGEPKMYVRLLAYRPWRPVPGASGEFFLAVPVNLVRTVELPVRAHALPRRLGP